ncbi:MAG: hypothetical protein M0R30_02145 [Methanoregula sp.]|nr:hypothetical protein [Methanoregula sp.]
MLLKKMVMGLNHPDFSGKLWASKTKKWKFPELSSHSGNHSHDLPGGFRIAIPYKKDE